MVWVLSLKQKFFVCIDFFNFEAETLKYGLPQGFILGSFLDLLQVNDTSDDNSLFHRHGAVEKIENVLNKEFSSLCQWFIDNKLPIHVDEDKNKSILLSMAKGLKKIITHFAGHCVKFPANLSEAAMASKVPKKEKPN